ncbi:1-deoxy-D-xylulose-5-phosphate synthase [Gammaproteobacteria bacterium]|nr:1-deoxy-D-xylulose-5-phosphate synthase [Gammaproteobacteria bacterium]
MKTYSEIPKSLPITPMLDKVNYPSDLKQLTKKELRQVADELREFLIYSVAKSGGHFGAGLGVIELTIALHYIFNAPEDNLIWDVGHQSYPHKIITGRKKEISTVRSKDGLHPFTNIEESIYDSFGTGHSSTSISAALGMAIAKPEKNHVAIIGDGAMTAGMAYEALAHAGSLDSDILVILNDNSMSISKNIGGFSNYLARIWASKLYTSIREGGKTALRFIPSAKNFAKRAETHFKGMLAPGTLFEELGFNYIGPMDGHNLNEMLITLQNLKDLKGPKLLHLITQKGKGFLPAEKNPIGFHALNKIEKNTKTTNGKKYSEVFGDWLSKKVEEGDDDLVAITPAMSEGSGMNDFAEKNPDKFYDVAIAEQHSMTFAAGLAKEGKKPILAIYSTFLQRAYDQLIHDVALQKLDVTLAIDRAGFVGGDGATHAGIFDISYLRCIPNMIIMSPSDENECWKMLSTGYNYSGPAAIRYPRGEGPGREILKSFDLLEIGKARVINEALSDLVIFSFGNMLNISMEISDEIGCSLVDMRFIKPLDEELIKKYAKTYKHIISIEENVISGGAGSAVNEYLTKIGFSDKLKIFGIPDDFPIVGSQEDQREAAGLSKNKILEKLSLELDLKDLNKKVSAQ